MNPRGAVSFVSLVVAVDAAFAACGDESSTPASSTSPTRAMNGTPSRPDAAVDKPCAEATAVDDAFAAGIGNRLDGWPNRDLDVGAIVASAPTLRPLADVLGVDDATVRKVLCAWGPS